MNAVFVAAWQRRRNQGTVWMVGGMLALLVIVPVAMAVIGDRRAVVASGLVVLGVTLAGGWASLVFSAMQQNHPGLARMVPGHVAALRRALGLSWLVVSLVFGCAVQLAGGRFGFEAGLWFGLGALVLSLTLRWPMSWAVLWVVPSTTQVWMNWTPVRAAWSLLARVDDQQPLLLAVGLAAMAALAMLALIEQGGARHERAWRKRQRWAAALGAPAPGDPRRSQLGVPPWLMKAATTPYRLHMARLSRDPRSRPMARAMMVLGPSAHWTGHVGAALAVGVVNFLVFGTLWIMVPNWREGASAAMAWGLTFGLMSFALNPLLNARQAFHVTRHEQGLLLLAPGVPQGTALNRAIAWRHAAHAVVAWVTCAALAAWLSDWTVADPGTSIAVALGTLPLFPQLWRDWSSTPAPSPARVVAVMLQLGVGSGVAKALVAWGLPLPALALLSVAITLAIAAWRWRLLARAPAAWPAGRLASGA